MTSLEAISDALGRPARPSPDPHADQAAVAAILTPDLEIVYMLRAQVDGDRWSGQVSFPGGRRDPGDPTPLATAVRETREEVGLDLTRARLLGSLDPVPTVGGPHMVIHPFVFHLAERQGLRLDRSEVVSVHRLSLDALLLGEGRRTMTWPFRGRDVVLPCVDFDGVRLWGLTLRMTDDLLHRLDGRGMGLARNAGASSGQALVSASDR